MTDTIQGEIGHLFERFHELLTGDPSVAGKASEALGKLAVFEGIGEFPVRVRCATLPWHTLEPATTEQVDCR